MKLSIPDYDLEDLEKFAFLFSDNILGKEYSEKIKDFILLLAKTFNNYNQIQNNYKEFHGYQDYYSLISDALEEIKEKKNEISNNKNIMEEIGINCLIKNFDGLENSSVKIIEIFKSLYEKEYNYNINIDVRKKYQNLDFIYKNIVFNDITPHLFKEIF